MRESLQEGLAQASAMFMAFVPRLLLAAVIVGLGYIVAKAACRIFSHVLERVGFNRLIERGGVKRTLAKSGWDASMVLGKILFLFVMLFVLQLAFGVFGPNPISAILTGFIAFLPNVFVAVIMVTLAAAFATAAKQLIEVALGALSYGRFVARVAAAAILVVGITAALSQLQVAPAIVNGLFYAMLAAIVGVTIVAVGGGGIAPMRNRWERALNRMENEVPRIQQATQAAPGGAYEAEGSRKEQPETSMHPPGAPDTPAPGKVVAQVEARPASGSTDPTGRFVERRSPPSRRNRDPGDGI